MTGALIVHVDLATDPAPIRLPHATTLFVFWWRDVPIGRIEHQGAAGEDLDIAALSGQVVDPEVLTRARALACADLVDAQITGPEVSVVICTRDRPEELERCLRSLPEQTLRPGEIVVVDNASRDGRTREVALAAGVTYVREDRPGLDFARNTGARAATGRIIAYTDDDVRLHPRWLERLVAAFDAPWIGAVTGLVLPAELETEAQLHFERYWGFGRGFAPKDFGPAFWALDEHHVCPAWDIGAGASMAFRHEVFETAGFFDERLDVGQAGCSGDSEFWHRALSKGFTCRYEPTAVAFHYHRREMSGLASQIFHYMRGHSASLMVQWERTGHAANRRMALIWKPRWYIGRLVRRLWRGPSQADRFLEQEIRGYVSGLLFYWNQPKPADPDEVAAPLPLARPTRTPRTSIVIPARNAAGTIGTTLDSLIAQGDADWEAIIVDDGSTDETAAICERYALRDPRFMVIGGEGRGVSAARNLALARARGQQLLFLDSDDWIDHRFLTRMGEALRSSRETVAAFCACQRVTPDGELSSVVFDEELSVSPFEVLARRSAPPIHAILCDRALIADLGGFDPSLRTGEDWDLWQRLARRGGRWAPLKETLCFYRMSPTSLSADPRQLIVDFRTLLARGFAPDPRVAAPAPEYADGARVSADWSPDVAAAYASLWAAAILVGRGEDGRSLLIDPRMLFTSLDRTDWVISPLIDGLVLGARTTSARLGDFSERMRPHLTALIDRIGEATGNPAMARRVQYGLESRIIADSDLVRPVRLGVVMGLRVDIGRPVETRPPAGVDTILVRFCDGDTVLGRSALPVLGVVGARDWRRLAIDCLGFAAVYTIVLKRSRLPLAVWTTLHSLRLTIRGKERWRAWENALLSLAGPYRPHGSSALALLEVVDAAALRGKAEAGEVPWPDTKPRPDASGDRSGDRQFYWESLFRVEDPWNQGSAYEQEKYERQLRLLPEGPIERALELACAEGHFTVKLAERVTNLLATDISTTALARARARAAHHGNVDFRQLDLFDDVIPAGQDLIVCSEVLYDLQDRQALSDVAAKLAAALAPGGRLLMAHALVLKDDMNQTGFDWDTAFGGAAIAATFESTPGLVPEKSLRTELYRIDLYRRLATNEAAAAAPEIQLMPIAALIEPEVARWAVWGGATARRSELRETERATRVPVLMYHRIAEDGPPGLARWRVSPDQFNQQLWWLRRNGYHAVSSAQLAWYIRHRQAIPGRPVLLTFDDGVQDFADTAWPLLRQYDLTAEVFIVTDRAGGTADWDAAHGPPAPLMTPETIVRLAAEGALFGSHTSTHAAADGLDTRTLAADLARSRATLESWVRVPVKSLAAPYGRADDRFAALARACGYEIAFTTDEGLATLSTAPLAVPRIEVPGHWTLDRFVARMEQASGLGPAANHRGNTPTNCVGVVVPAYNAMATLDETLRSVRAQTHRDLEIIVVDDGSKDSTRDIIAAHAVEDKRVRMLTQTNGGVAAARNLGWRACASDLVAFVDADDLWAPDKIEKQLAALHAGGSRVGLVYTWYAQIDAESRIFDLKHTPKFAGEVLDDLFRGNFVGNGSSPLIRKVALERIGGFEPALRAKGAQGCEDLLAYCRIAELYHFAVVPEALTGYRQLSDNMSSDYGKMLRSWELVAHEMRARHPRHGRVIDTGLSFYGSWLLRRAIRAGRLGQIPALARPMVRRHPLLLARILVVEPAQGAARRLWRAARRRRGPPHVPSYFTVGRPWAPSP